MSNVKQNLKEKYLNMMREETADGVARKIVNYNLENNIGYTDNAYITRISVQSDSAKDILGKFKSMASNVVSGNINQIEGNKLEIDWLSLKDLHTLLGLMKNKSPEIYSDGFISIFTDNSPDALVANARMTMFASGLNKAKREI